MSLEPFPGVAAVDRAIQPAARAAALQAPGSTLHLVECGEHHVRIVRIEREINRTRLVVFVKNSVPVLATVS